MGGCSIGGFRPDGRRFLLMNIFGGGWGGRPHEDGESASVSICQGDVRSAPIELQEIQYPFLIEKLCAAHGFRRRRQASRRARRRSDLSRAAEVRGQREQRAHAGPALGPCRRQARRRQRGRADPAATAASRSSARRPASQLEPGDRLTFGTAGGGGWGDPRKRDREEIERDIAAGLHLAGGGARDTTTVAEHANGGSATEYGPGG